MLLEVLEGAVARRRVCKRVLEAKEDMLGAVEEEVRGSSKYY